MKGYAYMDLDGHAVYKTSDYIDNFNPGFFSQNKHLIMKHWKFDTEDRNSMWRMFSSMQDLGISVSSSMSFIKSIGYNMENLKNANTVK